MRKIRYKKLVYACMCIQMYGLQKNSNIKVKNTMDQKISFQLTVHRIKTSHLHAYASKFPQDISGYLRGHQP